ncbi:MAG: ABC transporter permease, partial [Thermoanaerobaculum sp.]
MRRNSLWPRPGRTLLFAAALLAVATTSAVFMVVGHVHAPALPFPNPWQLVWVSSRQAHSPLESLTRAEVLALKEAGCFKGGFAFREAALTVELGSARLAVQGVYVEPGFLNVLGIVPRVGREFADDENRAGGAAVCLVSEGFWQRELGGDPAVVGRGLTINGRTFTVVGVVGSLSPVLEGEVFLPEAQDPDARRPPNALRNRFFIARLAPRCRVDTAQQKVSGLLSQTGSLGPPGEEEVRFDVVALPKKLLRAYRRFLPALLLGCGIVWLLGQTGLGFALGVEMAGRQGEAAVRSACGARRGALALELAIPPVVAIAFGGLLGLAVGVVGGKVLVAVAGLGEFSSVSGWLWCFAAGVAVIVSQVALAFLLGWYFSHSQRCEPYFRGAFGSQPRGLSLVTFRTLLFTEGSLAGALLLLLLGAQLVLIKLAAAQRSLPLHRLAFCLAVVTRPEGSNHLLEIYERLIQAGARVSGVRAVTLASGLWDVTGVETVRLVPTDKEAREARFFNVYPGFFATLGLTPQWGREFTSSDTRTSMPVVMLSPKLAAHACQQPGVAPCYVFWGQHRQRALVVGAAPELLSQRTGEPLEAIFVPLTQDPRGGVYVITVTEGKGSISTRLSQELRGADPRVAVWPAVAGAEAAGYLQQGPRLRRLFLSVLAFSGVLFAVAGWAAIAGLFV